MSRAQSEWEDGRIPLSGACDAWQNGCGNRWGGLVTLGGAANRQITSGLKQPAAVGRARRMQAGCKGCSDPARIPLDPVAAHGSFAPFPLTNHNDSDGSHTSNTQPVISGVPHCTIPRGPALYTPNHSTHTQDQATHVRVWCEGLQMPTDLSGASHTHPCGTATGWAGWHPGTARTQQR